MTYRPYPHDIDCVWLAADHCGHVGAFATGGIGPIPMEILRSEKVPVEELEDKLCGLPPASTVRLLKMIKRPDDFIDIAKRGLFAYDWFDVHRTAKDARGVYELVAAPVKPIAFESLPKGIAAIVLRLESPHLSFAESQALHIEEYVDCIKVE